MVFVRVHCDRPDGSSVDLTQLTGLPPLATVHEVCKDTIGPLVEVGAEQWESAYTVSFRNAPEDAAEELDKAAVVSDLKTKLKNGSLLTISFSSFQAAAAAALTAAPVAAALAAAADGSTDQAEASTDADSAAAGVASSLTGADGSDHDAGTGTETGTSNVDIPPAPPSPPSPHSPALGSTIGSAAESAVLLSWAKPDSLTRTGSSSSLNLPIPALSLPPQAASPPCTEASDTSARSNTSARGSDSARNSGTESAEAGGGASGSGRSSSNQQAAESVSTSSRRAAVAVTQNSSFSSKVAASMPPTASAADEAAAAAAAAAALVASLSCSVPSESGSISHSMPALAIPIPARVPIKPVVVTPPPQSPLASPSLSRSCSRRAPQSPATVPPPPPQAVTVSLPPPPPPPPRTTTTSQSQSIQRLRPNPVSSSGTAASKAADAECTPPSAAADTSCTTQEAQSKSSSVASRPLKQPATPQQKLRLQQQSRAKSRSPQPERRTRQRLKAPLPEAARKHTSDRETTRAAKAQPGAAGIPADDAGQSPLTTSQLQSQPELQELLVGVIDKLSGLQVAVQSLREMGSPQSAYPHHHRQHDHSTHHGHHTHHDHHEKSQSPKRSKSKHRHSHNKKTDEADDELEEQEEAAAADTTTAEAVPTEAEPAETGDGNDGGSGSNSDGSSSDGSGSDCSTTSCSSSTCFSDYGGPLAATAGSGRRSTIFASATLASRRPSSTPAFMYSPRYVSGPPQLQMGASLGSSQQLTVKPPNPSAFLNYRLASVIPREHLPNDKSFQRDQRFRYYVQGPAAGRANKTPPPPNENFVVFITPDGSKFFLPPQWGYQCMACHPPKWCFQLPYVTPQVMDIVAMFLQDANSATLSDALLHVGRKNVLHASSMLQLTPLFVYALAHLEASPQVIKYILTKAKWLLSQPILDWVQLHHQSQWQFVNSAPAMDILWYSRFCNEFNADISYSEGQFGWDHVYAECRVQAKLKDSEGVSPDELCLWGQCLAPLVISVDLSCCSGVTDDTLSLLLQFCSNLENLDVHCTSVTNRTVGKLTKSRPPLRYLNVADTAISQDAIDVLLEFYADIEVVTGTLGLPSSTASVPQTPPQAQSLRTTTCGSKRGSTLGLAATVDSATGVAH
eukprot:TRINITY_DN2324_c0_g1_i1.p1 TRINITY_DN2324_c0_g1~~TRINITY_DN2324_c0_g1_i1.p1  ORF type:complete len:1135 (+),score=261.50 TRINITY_DN2324_c0_g1_i1:81-3485(+)